MSRPGDAGFSLDIPPAPEAGAVPVTSGVDDAFRDLPGASESPLKPTVDPTFGGELESPGAPMSSDSYDRSAFDMASAAGTPSPAAAALSLPSEMSLDLGDNAARAPVSVPAPRVEDAKGPTGAAPEVGIRRPKPRPKFNPVTAVINAFFLLVAGVAALASVAVYVNDGRVEAAALNPTTLFNRLRGTRTQTGLGTSQVTNGLYETVAGRPVFYVTGVVTHFGGAPAGPVRVVVEIANRDGVVRTAEGYAGAVPTPEQLYEIGQAEDLIALQKHLAKTAPRVDPGKSAPFAVVFYEYPDDLADTRLHVKPEIAPTKAPISGG